MGRAGRALGTLLLPPDGSFHAPLAGKILIIGGSIANFTNVAATFKASGTLGMQGVRPGPCLPVCPSVAVGDQATPCPGRATEV